MPTAQRQTLAQAKTVVEVPLQQEQAATARLSQSETQLRLPQQQRLNQLKKPNAPWRLKVQLRATAKPASHPKRMINQNPEPATTRASGPSQ